jgi:hypothetical protein
MPAKPKWRNSLVHIMIYAGGRNGCRYSLL